MANPSELHCGCCGGRLAKDDLDHPMGTLYRCKECRRYYRHKDGVTWLMFNKVLGQWLPAPSLIEPRMRHEPH